MYQRVITILILMGFSSIQVIADEGFRVIDQGKTEFSVDFGTLDSCQPHTIEKYIRNSLHGDNQRGYLLIKQKFEIGTGCFEGHHPQNITVSAYDIKNIGKNNQKAIWQFKTTGIEGEIGKRPFSDFYIIKEYGCCGGGNVKKYFSLNTGNLIAYSSIDLLSVNLSSTSEKRYVGVEDTIAPSQTYEGKHVAVIFYSNSDHIIQKFVVMHPYDNEEWVLEKVELSENKLQKHTTSLNENDKTEPAEFNLLISLWCRCEVKPNDPIPPIFSISIPVLKDELDINSVVLKGDNRARIKKIDHNKANSADAKSRAAD